MVEKLIAELAEQPAEPAVWILRSKRDGSYFESVAIVGWSLFEQHLENLKNHSWVHNGMAEVVPLYAHPDQRIAALEGRVEYLNTLNVNQFARLELMEGLLRDIRDKWFEDSLYRIGEDIERIEAALGGK